MHIVLIVVACNLAVLALVGLILFIAYKNAKARTEQFQQIADQLGLQFFPKGDPIVGEAIGHLRLFNQGHARKTENMICGQTEDVELAIFGYRYTTGGGKSQQTHGQSVISFRSPHLALPEFELRPENMFHKIGKAFGYQDINFDSHPEFSKRYLLRGPNEKAIRQWFTPERIEFFESCLGTSVETSGDRMIFYRAGKRIKPDDVQDFMKTGFEVFGQMKNV